MIMHDTAVKTHNRNFTEFEFFGQVKYLKLMGHQWDVDGERSGPPI